MTVSYISNRPRFFPDIADAWDHRSLAIMLARRNIKIRYMQTLLGSIWIIIQPILLTGVLTVVGGMLLAAPSDGLPYVLFAFTGSVMWSAFQRTLTDTSTSLAMSGPIILKVYFPRLLVPVSSALTAAFDTMLVFLLLIPATLYYHTWPGWPFLFAVPLLALAILLAFAVGLWITMLDAIYRDVRMIVPTILQLAFYLSPVMYATQLVPKRWIVIYELNPVVGLLKAFRWSLIAKMPPPSLPELVYTGGLTLVMLLSGLFIFARLEQYAVDRI
jgi:lipopolysaccharide transport system permease protein